ncbi:MAG: glycine/betaine ABC transporter ATP-binding protein, partial [Pseudomonas sp.]
IFISHDIEEAIRIGHRIAIMEGGRVVQIGTPQELINQPANDYVRTFFKSFDSSRVLKAGDVAKFDPAVVCKVNGKAPSFQAGVPFGYLVDDRGQLLGVVDTDAKGATASDCYSLHEQRPVYTDTPLHEVLGIAADLPYPVPVLDRQGAFKGTLSKNELLQTLSRH